MVEEKKGLMEQMDALVREHLPEKVGATLREELVRLEKVEEELEAAKQLNVTLRTDLNELRKLKLDRDQLNERQRDLEIQADELQSLRIKLEKQDAVLTAVGHAHSAHVNDMKEVVLAVFSNNRFKYTRHGSQDVFVPPYRDQYGGMGGDCTRMCDHDETVEGEGDPPPISAPAAPPVSPMPPHDQDS
jgi:hypothetical protein